MIQRFATNPLLRPADVQPGRPDLEVTCLLNPGAFRYKGRTGLLLRVAERPVQKAGRVSVPVMQNDTMEIREFDTADPELSSPDARVFSYRGEFYLTTLSHLRLAWSDDGEHFVADKHPTLHGAGPLESFGIEDCRVTEIEGEFHLTYTAVSPAGVGVGLMTTRDWQSFTRHGMILPPHNKDCAMFPERIGGRYVCLHRPSGVDLGGNYIWLASSPDRLHWGHHRCICRTRPGHWDSGRVGGGAAPIRTPQGWLCIYHGATPENRYCLGALLLDLDDPSRVLARSKAPLMEPEADYEKQGFFGEVVFTNGHVVDGDVVTFYYGASDEVVCGARLRISEVLAGF